MSIKRISKFLNADELESDIVERKVHDPGNAVEVDNASFSWDEETTPVLRK